MCKDNCANQCGTPFLLALNEECEVQELLELSDVTMENLMWYSENPSIVTINLYEGFIDACGVGCTRIYAVNQNGVAVYCTNITVSDNIHVSSIELDRDSVALEEETSTVLAATLYPYNATNKTLEWESSNTQVAQVVNGKVCALKQGTAVITVRAKDGSDKSANCNVTVTGDVLVTSVEIDPEEITLVKDSFWALNVTVNPENATNPTLLWHSDDESIAIVTPNEGVVHTKNIGTVRICAEAQDGSGVSGTCMINVVPPVAVSGICLCQTRTSVAINDERRSVANVIICPENATNTAVTWSSSNTSIAAVDAEGRVTGLAEGEVTITAKTKDGGYTASCTITVKPAVVEDTREKVQVVKGLGDNFGVWFEDGTTWNFVGDSMSDPNLRSGCALWWEELDENNSHSNSEEDGDEIAYSECERKYLDNLKQNLSIEKIAYLYLLDPVGIEYYMKNGACVGMSLAESLFFKDDVFRAIFGRMRYFTLNDSGVPIYHDNLEEPLSNDTRKNVYSQAEVLFGVHKLPYGFIEFLVDYLPQVVDSILGVSNVYSAIKLGVQTYQVLFFSGSVTELSQQAVGFVDSIAEKTKMENKLSGVLAILQWVVDAVNIVDEIVDKTCNSLEWYDVSIFEKVENQNYQTIFIKNGKTVSLQEFIDCYNGEIN